LEHNKLEQGLNDLAEQTSSQIANKQDVDFAEIGMQITDIVVSSGVLEQFGTEIGISGAIIASAVGIYWKLRGGKPSEVSEVNTEDNSINTKGPSNEEAAKEEVVKLKTIEEQQIESGNASKS
jgi:hypothetical protein